MASETQLEKSTPAMPAKARLTDRLAALWSLGRVRWAEMKPAQRNWSLAAAGLLGMMGAVLLWYALRIEWRTLYADLDPEDARQVAQVLSQAQIPYEPTASGTGIRVPAPQLDKARLATAAKGGLKSGRLGFEIFDKPNWVGSEFDEQVNYQRALEGELEHTIATLADVESARVHLVLPHDSLFRESERPAKASVVLKLRHRSLADGEPEAIRNLVASAVDGLSADRVVLVDAAGHLPLGPQTPDALRLGAEQALEEKLINTLEPVTGAGNVRASVTLDYDRAAREETDEDYDPDQTVTLSMQRTEQTTGGKPVPAGVPGTASNAPNAQPLPVYPPQSTPPDSAKSESGTYGASKSVRHLIESPGKLRRMTAAIVVNDRLLQLPARGRAAQWQARSADELRNLTTLAQAAVGFDAARGDMLTVEDLTFADNRTLQPVSLPAQVLSDAEKSPVLVKYGALLLGLVLVLAFGLRPALRKARPPVEKPAKKTAKDAAAIPPSAEPQGIPAAATVAQEPIERTRAQEIFDEVSDHLKREPTQSSRMLQSWIHSD